MTHLTHEEIHAYLDGECSENERERAASHVAICAKCARELDDFGALKSLLSSMGEAELPRSFMLPAEFGNTVPLTSPMTSAVTRDNTHDLGRFEPVARIFSIAAVLAFLVLGGGQLAGWIGDDTDTSNNVALNSETEVTNNALQDQEPAPERGELREQGDSAAAGAGSLTSETARVDTAAQVDTSLTPLEITTVGLGVVALAAIASWILIHYRAGSAS